MSKYKIAVIPGDGIGKEVVPEGIRVLEAAAGKFGIRFEWDELPWSCEYFAKTGRMMSEDGLIAAEYPDVQSDCYHIDILAAHFVRNPDWFDVIVASNLFGDILSDLGPACTGTMAIAPSANLNPPREFPSMFEPVHGSAPDIFGRKIANPIGQIWSGAMMLEHLGQADAAAVMSAIELVLCEGPRARDLGGRAGTQEVGRAIADAV